MSDNQFTAEEHAEQANQLVAEFIALANSIKDRGQSIHMINSALMSASVVYATYVSAGNEGYLQASGVEKVAQLYKNNLAHYQQYKKSLIVRDDNIN